MSLNAFHDIAYALVDVSIDLYEYLLVVLLT